MFYINNLLKWFGNSKIIDNNNKPKIVYHGTDHVFNEFDLSKGKKWSSKLGFWFSSDKEHSENFGNNIIECYIKIENPKIISYKLFDLWRMKNHNNNDFWSSKRNEYINSGYDGIVIKDEDTNFADIIIQGVDYYVCFYSDQIKASDNNGEFGKNNKNIYENSKIITNFNEFCKIK